MAQPTINDLQPVDPILTNMLLAYMNSIDGFVALKCFPPVNVDKDSGTYFKFPKNYWFKDSLKSRAPGTTFPRVGYSVDTDTYATLQWAAAHAIPDEHRANSQLPMDLERLGIELLGGMSLLRKERAFATDFMTTSVWGTDATPTDWDDASGVPVTDALTARRTVNQATGKQPNSIVMGEIVYDALLVNAQVKGLLQYTQTMTIASVQGLLAAVLGFQNLWVSTAIYNSANEAQTAVMAPVIDDDALVFVSDPGAGIFGATAGKTFVWQPGGGAGAIRTYRAEDSDADVLKHKEQWDQKLVASDLGYFFPDIV